MWGCHCSDSGRYCNKGVPSLARELPLVAGIAKKHIYMYVCVYIYIHIVKVTKLKVSLKNHIMIHLSIFISHEL